ncbi:armadillo-type protein [Zopfochytrium polystomum]|nr:armadillo-type protein [Zopfochytrium polystomum]
MARLEFSQRLVPHTAAKPIPTSDLVRRLQELHGQLSKLEQQNVDRTSLAVVRKDLASPSLLHHRDKGVRALTACCLADILSLFAPDAPYKQHELKDIFEFFLKQINYIGDLESPYFPNYFYLLESLSTVKSVVLVLDLNAEELVVQFFKDIFQLVRPDFQKNVYGFLLDILQQLVEECQFLNSEVVDTIISQFNTKRRAENSAAFQMAVDLCNNATDKLQRYVCQYFSDVFISATRGGGDDDENSSHEEFERAHALILEINAVARGVLLSVIPLLEEELKYDDAHVRALAMDVLGKMISGIGSRVAVIYTTAWKNWLDRRNDKSTPIRVSWLAYCPDILRHHPELSQELCQCLEQKLQDPDEKVRLAAVKVVGQLDVVCAGNTSSEVLQQVMLRARDRKHNIRNEAIRALARLFKMMYTDIVNPLETAAADKYGGIPGNLLELLYLNESETNHMVEKVWHEDILPPNYDDAARTDRLLKIVAVLNDRQYNAFVSMLDRQANMRKTINIFLNECEAWNGGIVDKDKDLVETRLNQVIQFLAYKFSDPKRASAHLLKFAKNNENRVYKLLRAIMDESAEYKAILKNNTEVTKRLDAHQGLLETFSVFLRQISLTMVGKSTIPSLIEAIRSFRRSEASQSTEPQRVRVRTPEQSAAEKLIKTIAQIFPSVYQSHVDDLIALLTSPDATLVTHALEAVAKFSITFPEQLRIKDELDSLVKLALEGSVTQASKAAVILAKVPTSHHREKVMNAIVASLNTASVEKAIAADKLRRWSRLPPASGAVAAKETGDDDMDLDAEIDGAGNGVLQAANDPARLTSKLAALGQFTRFCPGLVEEHHSEVTRFIVKELLLKSRDEDAHAEDWVPFEDLHVEGALKVLGIKALVKRVQGCETPEEAAQQCEPVFRLLTKILAEDGEIVPNTLIPTCPACKSHLRLVASKSILKLCKIPSCAELLTVGDRAKLVLTIQDPSWEMRDAFVEKLRKHLQDHSIPFKFAVVLAMAGHEPDPGIKQKAKAFFSILAQRSRIGAKASSNHATIESLFPALLHTITLHPDFGTTDGDAADSAKYIQFFLEVVVNPENVSFLFHSAAQLKTLADLHNSSSEGLYHLSDLAQVLLQEYCANHGWSLPSYPASIPYDKELFKRLPRGEGAENLKKSYVSKAFIQSRQATAGKVKPPKTPKSSRRRSGSHPGTPGVSDAEDGGAKTDNDEDGEKTPVERKKLIGLFEAEAKPTRATAKRKRAAKKSDGEESDEPVERRVSAPRSVKAAKRYYESSQSEGEEAEYRVPRRKRKPSGESAKSKAAPAEKEPPADEESEDEVPLQRKPKKVLPLGDKNENVKTTTSAAPSYERELSQVPDEEDPYSASSNTKSPTPKRAAAATATSPRAKLTRAASRK